MSYGAGTIGYVLLLIEFFGFSMVSPAVQWMAYHSVLLVFYGLYFGKLGRDIAEWCAEQMAVQLGYGYVKKKYT